jgi:hypothetical protein
MDSGQRSESSSTKGHRRTKARAQPATAAAVRTKYTSSKSKMSGHFLNHPDASLGAAAGGSDKNYICLKEDGNDPNKKYFVEMVADSKIASTIKLN